jgi:hypothetical protein
MDKYAAVENLQTLSQVIVMMNPIIQVIAVLASINIKPNM